MTHDPHGKTPLTGIQMADLEDFARWLENAKAEDFRPAAETPEQEAFGHMWDACAILFREGHGASGILKTLTNVIFEMETDEDDLDPDEWALEED